MKQNPLDNLIPPTVENVTFSTSEELSSTLPTFFDVEKPFKQLASYPGLLYTQTLNATSGVVQCIYETKIEPIVDMLKMISDEIDSGLISFQKASNIDNPEKYWSDRIKALFKEYSMWFWNKMLEFLDSIIPFSLLDMDMPILGPPNKVRDWFSEEGRASILENITNKIDDIMELIVEPFKSMYNNLDISSPGMKAKAAYEYIYDQVIKLFIDAALTAMGAIEDTINTFIAPATLEDVPSFSDLKGYLDPSENLETIKNMADSAKGQLLGLIFTIVPVPPNVPLEELTLRMVIDYNIKTFGDTMENLLITISDATFGMVILPAPIFGENGFTLGDFVNIEISEILDNTPSELSDIVQVYPLTIVEVLLELFILPPVPPFIPNILRLGDIIGITIDKELSTSNFISPEVIRNKITQLAPMSALMAISKAMMDWLTEVIGLLLDALGMALPPPLKIPFYMSDLLDILFSPIGGFPPTPPDLSTPC